MYDPCQYLCYRSSLKKHIKKNVVKNTAEMLLTLR